MCRVFRLIRDVDESGVSGTGHIADGVHFDNGTVVVCWRTKTSSTTIFRSVDDVLAVHGHAGKTRMEYACETEWPSDGSARVRSPEDITEFCKLDLRAKEISQVINETKSAMSFGSLTSARLRARER